MRARATTAVGAMIVLFIWAACPLLFDITGRAVQFTYLILPPCAIIAGAFMALEHIMDREG